MSVFHGLGWILASDMLTVWSRMDALSPNKQYSGEFSEYRPPLDQQGHWAGVGIRDWAREYAKFWTECACSRLSHVTRYVASILFLKTEGCGDVTSLKLDSRTPIQRSVIRCIRHRPLAVPVFPCHQPSVDNTSLAVWSSGNSPLLEH